MIPSDPFHPSIALARRLARAALSSGSAFLDLLEESLESAPREAWIAAPGRSLASDSAFLDAFPPPDVSPLAPPDADEPEIRSAGMVIFLERSLAQSCAFSEELVSLGSDFSSDSGARAREAFLRLGSIALSDPASREPFLREAFSAWTWNALAVPFEEPELPEEMGLEPLFWPARLSLRLAGSLSEEISHPFPDDPKIPLAHAAMLAVGCPPESDEAWWLLDAFGGEDALASAFGPLGAARAVLFAADTLFHPVLESLAPALPPGDELLARQAWALCCSAAADAWDALSEPVDESSLPEEIPLEEVRAARRESLQALSWTVSRCAGALLEPLGPPPEDLLRDMPPPLLPAFSPSSRLAEVIPLRGRETLH